jgi:hypothetical protein
LIIIFEITKIYRKVPKRPLPLKKISQTQNDQEADQKEIELTQVYRPKQITWEARTA